MHLLLPLAACFAAAVTLQPPRLLRPPAPPRTIRTARQPAEEITGQTAEADGEPPAREREVLTCRIRGFYPFPESRRLQDGAGGLLGWLFKDTHQAILVRSTASTGRLFMDFMTEGGQAHPVWWDETAKWGLWLGGDIRGEVRIRRSGGRGVPGSKLERLERVAARYGSRMNLYTSNCRTFCARIQREVERLNAEDAEEADSSAGLRTYLAAEGRLAFGVLCAGLLPLLYPVTVLWLCWVGVKGM